MSFYAATPEALAAFVQTLGPVLGPGTILCLSGPLGAGKTTLVRGLVEHLGGEPEQVHSPTFSLVHQYALPGGAIIHCDFHRLADATELPELGGLEFFAEQAIYCVEWPERISALLAQVPNKKVFVKITITPPGRSLEIFPTKN